MITSLKIHGYRGLQSFEMSNLGRVNLLVGTNNCGKSSVLEAIHCLISGGNPTSIWRPLFTRGEGVIGDEREVRRSEPEFDISHLFTGHDIKEGSKFSIAAKNDIADYSLTCAVGQRRKNKDHLFDSSDEDILDPGPRFAIHMTGSPQPRVDYYPLTRRLGITSASLSQRGPSRNRDASPIQIVPTSSHSGDELATMWGTVALTKQEDMVLNALRKIDPNIERIASVQTSLAYNSNSRGGFKIKLQNSEIPIPVGSMGDGIWRMLSIAISLARSRGGVLLVDEIDTGLHYTVMDDMWKLVNDVATESNTQVFATTHSSDCVNSLASICNANDVKRTVTIHRIESGRSPSVLYTEREIIISAKKRIEMR